MPAKNLAIMDDDIWRRGVPLDAAVWNYASDAEAAVLAQPQGPLLLNELCTSVGQVALSVGAAYRPEIKHDPTYAELERQTQETKRQIAQRKVVTAHICADLVAAMQNGRFVLYGYALQRRAKDRPVIIPADLYDGRYIDWGSSKIKGNGLEFVSVVIVEAEAARQINVQADHKLPSIIAVQKRGPISSQEAIENAVNSLIADGTLPNNNMQKQNVELVGQRVHQLFPGEFPHNRGLGRESIRKVLAKSISRPKIN